MPKFIYDIIPPEVRRGVVAASQEVSKWIKFLRMFLKTSKYGIPLLIIIVVGFGALLVLAFQPKTELIEIFPTEYKVETWSEEIVSGSEGIEWQNGENAFQREVGKEADLVEFSSENSAILFGGEIEELSSPSEILIEKSEEIVSSESVGELATESEETLQPSYEGEGQVASESEVLEEVIGQTSSESEELVEEEIAGLATESEPVYVPEGTSEDKEEIEEQIEEEIIEEEIPEGVGGCELCQEEPSFVETTEDKEIASDAEDLLNLMEQVEEIASISQPPLIKYSIIFSGFDYETSVSFNSFKRAKLMFSFAADKGDEKDALLIEYKISEAEWKTLKLIKLDEEQSNSTNNGYWQTNVLEISSWQDLNNLEIRFIIETTNPENRLPVYLDALWLNVEYSKPEKPAGIGEIGEIEKKNLGDEYELELVSDKKDFKMNEDLEFEFRFQKKKITTLASVAPPEDNISSVSEGDKSKDVSNVKINSIKAMILDSEDNIVDEFNPQIQDQGEGEFIVVLDRPNLNKFKPGKYKLKIELENGEGVFIGEQEFTWGVLAINVNKSIYLPGEEAYIQMAVLDDLGHTICDARLRLEIRNPKPETRNLSTEDRTIEYSGQCGADNVTYVPDYFAYYQVDIPGIYEMKLTNLDNGYEITDSFEVRGFVPFDIERIGPTRIFPPAIYEMVIKIKINQDFEGRIIETMPSGFETKYDELRIKKKGWEEFVIFEIGFNIEQGANGEKKLIWQNIPLLILGDKLEIRYMFDAPDISPYLYLLGPLEFYE